MRIQEIKLYQVNELTEEAQQTAIVCILLSTQKKICRAVNTNLRKMARFIDFILDRLGTLRVNFNFINF